LPDGRAVPPVLLSGHHADIRRWRREQSLAITAARRPDLIEAARAAGRLSKADEAFLTKSRQNP
jgi:tRNA (guanine37-N1)-methyltransferase